MKNHCAKACAAAQPDKTYGEGSPSSFGDHEHNIVETKVRKVPIQRILKVATVLDFS
jgi:hypothetical protein